MITINKQYFIGKDKYKWLGDKLEPNFELIIGDKSKIIYGFNGIGKSSLSRCLKDYNQVDNLKFLDYEDNNSKSNNNVIKLSPYIYDIEQLSNDIKSQRDIIEFSKYSKQQGFVKTNASKGPSFLKIYANNLVSGKHPAEAFVDNDTYKSFVARHSYTNPIDFFKIVKYLESVAKPSTELDNYRKNIFKDLLDKLEGYVVDKIKCPLCDNKVDDIHAIINNKKNELESCKSVLVDTMKENNIKCDEETIEKYLSLYNELSLNSDLLNDYVVCGNDVTKHEELIIANDELRKMETELNTFKAKKKDKYNQIKKYEDSFKKDIAKYIKIEESSIAFNDKDEEIIITLDRESKTYSTGEQHILWFLTEIYSFLGSDFSIMILDDPASSLDLVNLYKIAFEIVNKSLLDDKILVVFTHSSELINAINSQYPNKFDIYYLEEYKSQIYCDVIDYKNKSIINVIDSEYFATMSPNIYESLRKRDFNDDSSSEHNVYHYSTNKETSNVDPANLSNYKLIDIIDSYVGINRKDFYTNSFNKVLYILSLRVWLEKAMFNLIPTSDKKRQIDYLIEHTLQGKINIICDSKNYSNDLFKANNIRKEDLISKKVMLNQNAHYYSQIMPFAYAINLSLDDVDREIKEIRAIIS